MSRNNNMQTVTASSMAAPPPPSQAPTIRLVSAIPSATGNSSSTSLTNLTIHDAWGPVPPLPSSSYSSSPLAPKSSPTRKRLVPKKSKLSMLSAVTGRSTIDKELDRVKDLSDVVRRVGASGSTSSMRGGFEIYVDPTMDEDIEEIVVIKKKKSRAGLDGMKWGTLGEVTNVPSVAKEKKEKEKEGAGRMKVKSEESKWWSIGRGRKDSKEKEKEKESRAKSPEPRDPYPRSKTPEPFKQPAAEPPRTRFNSLDSTLLLSNSRKPPTLSAAPPLQSVIPTAQVEPEVPYTRSRTPTFASLLSGAEKPPTNPAPGHKPNQGSVALRAMRSVRSLARIGSWAHLKAGDENMAPKETVKEKKVKVKKVKKDDKEEKGEKKSKKSKKEKEGEDGEKKKTKKKKKKGKEKEKETTKDLLEPEAEARLSTSSFEIGAPTPMAIEKTHPLGKKKRSILGIGLPSSMTMKIRNASSGTTSSVTPSIPEPFDPSTISNDITTLPNFGHAGIANAYVHGPSVESVHVPTIGRDRAGSVMSTSTTVSSLRPASSRSGGSKLSDGSRLSSGSSVRWDEEVLENAKQIRRREREERGRERERDGQREKRNRGASTEREKSHSLEGRKRIPISDIFTQPQEPEMEMAEPGMPVLTIKAASADGHGVVDDENSLNEESVDVTPADTPVKTQKTRVRPLSEHLLGRTRPKPLYEGEDGVLSILDAATNDLAQLINHLDLEATTATPDLTPLRLSPAPPTVTRSSETLKDSPTKNKSSSTTSSGKPAPKVPHHLPSIGSLRPYAQSRKNVETRTGLKSSSSVLTLKRDSSVNLKANSNPNQHPIGQQIAPWRTLLQTGSSAQSSSLTTQQDDEDDMEQEETPTLRVRHRHRPSMSPVPEPEPSPVFQPLRPAKSRGHVATLRAQFEKQQQPEMPFIRDGASTVRAPSLRTFGSRSSASASERFSQSLDAGLTTEEEEMDLPTPSPVFKRALDSFAAPMDVDDENNHTVPLPPGARRLLGMNGTMGGSDVSVYNAELDASDPDSDIPDELQEILKDGEDTLSFQEILHRDEDVPMDEEMDIEHDMEHEVPSGPPALELPTFRQHLAPPEAVDGDAMSDDDFTKKSFDFTAEIKKLSESAVGLDRQSFVEQLEEAFRTPAKIDLRYGFPRSLDVNIEVPPVPKLPTHLRAISQSSLDNSDVSAAFESYSESQQVEQPSFNEDTTSETSEKFTTPFELFPASGSQMVDVKEPILTQDADSSFSSNESHDIVMSDFDACVSLPKILKAASSASSSGSRPSDGQLNKAFKFGGPSKAPLPQAKSLDDLPKSLADIIPPPSHARTLSNSSLTHEGDSVLKSIYAKATTDMPRPRPRINSDTSARLRVHESAPSYYRHSRHSSGISFAGFDSFDEVRRGFEIADNQPFYPPAASSSRRYNQPRQRDSFMSIASVSSYGRAHDYGLADPFDFGLPCLRERPSSEELSISMSMSVDDTFSFIHHQPRRRVASDASDFYFNAPAPGPSSFNRGGHRRNESNMSQTSLAPPVSLFNRNYGARRRCDSSSSVQSVGMMHGSSGGRARSYGVRRRCDSSSSVQSLSMMHGSSGGRAIFTRHRQEASVDSINSDFSAVRLGRPGLGDKMFDRMFESVVGARPTSVSPSPPQNAHFASNRSSFDFDSVLDHDRPLSTVEDSLFDNSGEKSSSSLSESVFGGGNSQASTLLRPPKYRPLSVLSCFEEPPSPAREDDTMISMLVGGRVRRKSIDASPGVRAQKRKHSDIQPQILHAVNEYRETPKKARIVKKPSIASIHSSIFGGERMISAKLPERQSLEDSCLVADGEDISGSLQNIPLFSRPGPASRSRSSTCTSSSGADTPPLSSADGLSSMDEGSQSSIDLSHINFALSNSTHSIPSLSFNRVRARPRGNGHRRRSYIPAARSSVYETIEEEKTSSPSPNKYAAPTQKGSPTISQPIFIVEPQASEVDPELVWSEESGIVALRRYYALKDEAQTTVIESKRVWHDTPFSIFALQSFEPPRHPAGMQALLEHSVRNYGPLPSELRPRRVRSRTSSRASPYPQARVSKAMSSSSSPATTEEVLPAKKPVFIPAKVPVPVLQSVPVHTNIASAPLSLKTLMSKPFSHVATDPEPKRDLGAFDPAPHARSRVPSTTRFGWTKRMTTTGNVKASTDLKENSGQGTLTTPGDSLRISRPRPRGRPTPASTAKPIRV